MVTYWVQTVQWIERRYFPHFFQKTHRDFADFYRDFNTSLVIRETVKQNGCAKEVGSRRQGHHIRT